MLTISALWSFPGDKIVGKGCSENKVRLFLLHPVSHNTEGSSGQLVLVFYWGGSFSFLPDAILEHSLSVMLQL